jgi:hypothetical protein
VDSLPGRFFLKTWGNRMAVEVVLLESMTSTNMSWNPGDVYPAADKGEANRLIERGIARPIEELEMVRKSFHIVPPAMSTVSESLTPPAPPPPPVEEHDDIELDASGDLPPLPAIDDDKPRRPGRARKNS